MKEKQERPLLLSPRNSIYFKVSYRPRDSVMQVNYVKKYESGWTQDSTQESQEFLFYITLSQTVSI